jgi:hypothetical protein
VGPRGPTPIVFDSRDERYTDTLLVRVLCIFVQIVVRGERGKRPLRVLMGVVGNATCSRVT